MSSSHTPRSSSFAPVRHGSSSASGGFDASSSVHVRMLQLTEEAEHAQSAEQKRQALLKDRLQELQQLIPVIQNDNWKYELDVGQSTNKTSASSKPLHKHIVTTTNREKW